MLLVFSTRIWPQDFVAHFKYYWPDYAILLAFAAILFVVIHYRNIDDDRLMAQCLGDGRKEYECVSMLKHNSSNTTVMPVYIPRWVCKTTLNEPWSRCSFHSFAPTLISSFTLDGWRGFPPKMFPQTLCPKSEWKTKHRRQINEHTSHRHEQL